MSAHALALGGPRPAELLPPTLQPHAVASAAPRTDRRLSFLVSCLVYSSFVGTLAVLARNPNALRAPWVPPTIAIVDLTGPDRSIIEPPPPPPVGIAHAAGPTQTRPADWIPRPLDVVENPPDITPQNLPTVDRRLDSIYRPDMPVGDGKIVNSGIPGSIIHETGAVSAPKVIDLEPSAVQVTHQVQPTYPFAAKLARIQGPVVLQMIIDARGVPTDVRVISSPHPSLEGESIRVAQQWRFEPARLDGRPIAAKFRLTLNYVLKS